MAMPHPLQHAESSTKKFGGKPEDYLPIHNWFDESKAFFADFRHRALRHHAEGIFLAEKLFGVAIVKSDGKKFQCAMWESNMSAKILAAFPQHRIGCHRLSRSAGCMASGWTKKVAQARRFPYDQSKWP
jgi:hypothetical protein